MDFNHLKLAALEITAEKGLLNLTRAEVCRRAGIPDGSFQLKAGRPFGQFVEELAQEWPVQPTALVIERNRVPRDLLRVAVIQAFNKLAEDRPVLEIKRSEVAEFLGINARTINRVFRNMEGLRAEALR